MTTNTPAPEMLDLPDFHLPEVQAVYETLCGIGPAPYGQHWESWVSRHIVLALSKLRAPVADADELSLEAQEHGHRRYEQGFAAGWGQCAASAPVAGEAQPTAYLTLDEEGSPSMLFFDVVEARAYCALDEEPEPLFRHAAPQASEAVRDAALEEAAKVALNAPITADMLDSEDAKAVAVHTHALICVLKSAGAASSLQPHAPPASEAQCSCPSDDGSLRHPCAAHPPADRDRAALGIPPCGGPLCGQADHHPLCRVAMAAGGQQTALEK
ncbi:hypothetical protein ABE485_06125 [Achromobacter spanius]|uniref:hypothetical protein n=1 Tax=Achromobacter spanius TaxID=217203 RepID=UPI0032081CAC